MTEYWLQLWYTQCYINTGDIILMVISASNLNRFSKLFYTVLFSSKFAVKPLIKTPALLVYVATLTCKTPVSENKRPTINYKVT